MARTIGVAVIGAGMVGRAHAHGFRSLRTTVAEPVAEVRLIAVADTNAALAEDLARRFEFERVARSVEEIAAAADIDAAVVALPNHEHRAAVETLLAAGKHVLCEKPLGPTAAESYAIWRAAERSGIVHMVGFNQRRAPGIAAIQQAVANGELGIPRQFIGRYLTDYACSPEGPHTWRYDRRLAGGGALHDIGAHMIDNARYLLGEIAAVDGARLTTVITERPVPRGHVVGHGAAEASGEMAPVDTDDIVSFTATFENDATGDFTASRIATGFRNSSAFTVIGDRGAATFDTERFAEFGWFDGSDAAESPGTLNGFRRVVSGPRHPYLNEALVMPVAGVGHGYAETFVAQADVFVRAVVEGEPVAATFEDGYRVALVCEAVQLAAEEGRRVTITEVAARMPAV